MSEEEKDMICGQAIRQHREAKKTLGCVRKKGAELGAMLKRMSDAFLRERSHAPSVRAKVSGTKITLQGDHEIYYHDLAWPSKEDLIQVLNDETRLQQELTDLEACLRELGYGEYAR